MTEKEILTFMGITSYQGRWLPKVPKHQWLFKGCTTGLTQSNTIKYVSHKFLQHPLTKV